MYDVEENFNRYLKDIGSRILFSPLQGLTIKEIRRAIEVSQEDVSNLLGVRRETISRIETGAIIPTSSIIKRFSKIASIIKIFRDINALKDTASEDPQIPFNPTFFRTHFSLSSEELDALMQIGNISYNKTKKKILRRTKI
jgi:transcriptional regulator with XRE-family HTH domain